MQKKTLRATKALHGAMPFTGLLQGDLCKRPPVALQATSERLPGETFDRASNTLLQLIPGIPGIPAF